MKNISILTPTYNRSHTLPRLFESLQLQTSKEFDWIIIDDGSTDDTRELVKFFKTSSLFAIHYIYQKNQGKHLALNTGIPNCNSEFIFIVDSDDALTSDAVNTIQCELQGIDSKINGICFRKSSFAGKIIGKPVNLEKIISTPQKTELIFQGDLAYILRKSALQNNPFPTIKGEKFFPEGYIWGKIGEQGNIIYFPQKTIYLCEYLSDGLTKNFTLCLKNNPKGFSMYYLYSVKHGVGLSRKFKSLLRFLQSVYYIVKKHKKLI